MSKLSVNTDTRYLLGGTFKAAEPASPESIMSIEGYASTVDLDRMGDIIEPSAWAESMPTYMEHPVVLVNHVWDDLPVGKVTDYHIDQKGLFVKVDIARTAKGYEVKTLIDMGVLNSFSVGFRVLEHTEIETGWRIIKAELIENSIVNVPANMEALFEEAKSLNIELKHLNKLYEGGSKKKKGVRAMPAITLDKVKEEVDSSLSPIQEELDKVQATAGDLGEKVGDLTKILNQMKDANAGGDKTSAELRELIDKVSVDVKASIDQMDDLKKEVKDSKRRTILERAGAMSPDINIKSLATKTAEEVDIIFAGDPQRKELAHRFLKKKDEVILADALLEASSLNNDGTYHRLPRDERIKTLKLHRELNEFAKAMDTATAAEGTEYVPTLEATTLEGLVRVELKMAGLFDEFNMPSPTYELPLEGADTLATLKGQTTTVVSAFDSEEQTPGTGKVTFTAQKARSRIQVSAELTEDSVIAIMPMVQSKAVMGIARAIDRAVVNGNDGADSQLDSGYTVGATDFRKAWDGLRWHWNNGTGLGTTTGVSMATFNEANLRLIRQPMDKYAISTSELAWFTSVKTWLGGVMNLTNYQTLDKFGPMAVVLTGEVLKIDGIPLIVTEWVANDLNASGVYDGVTTTKSAIGLVHRPSWMRGNRRGVQVAVEKDIINDVYQVVAFKRVDFKPLRTPTAATDPSINMGYNV